MNRCFVVVVVAAAACAVGCTSFAFKQGAKGTAPSELQDRAPMAAIAGGSFEMGVKIGDPDEVPAHKVLISAFLLDKTEVTLRDYGRCVDARVCKAVAPAVTAAGDDAGVVITDDHPVVGTTWYDAKKYCEWVGKRLPTEAEWEYAARRGRNGGLYPWAGPWNSKNANSRGEADGYGRTSPVGTFAGGDSIDGVHDLAGNAAEWVNDWYDPTYYLKTTERDPQGPEAPSGSKVARGGSWSDPDHVLRSVTRQSIDPNVSNNAFGFRCAANP